MDDGMESTIESEDVFEVQLPTFEVLKQLPSTYRKPVDQIDTISIDDCRCNENEHVDELTESIEGQEVRHISNQTSEAFLGLRIRLRSRLEPNDGQGNISPLSIGVSADTAVIRNTRSRSRTTSTMNSLPFKKQRRLSQLFLSPTLQESTSSPIEIPQPRLSLHGRHRSASSKGESEMFDDEAASHQWYRQFRQRDLECGRTEPVGLLLNRNPIWQPFVPPVEGGQPNSKNENKKSANLEGLLPDGRTRHPSAGSGDLKASLATFRKDNQTTETSSGSASPDSINLSPSASMRIDVDSNVHALRWPSNEVLPISPITDSSDRSMPQTPGENHTILSPMTAIESSPRFIKPLYSEGQTFSDPLNAAVFRSPNINITKQAPSTVIFPVPPCAQISRAKELTNQLNNIQQYFDGNDKDKQTIMDAFALLQSTIGSNGINQLNTLIKKAGERDCTTDEDLLRSIASNCFGLVDMDLAIENGGKILCGGGSGFDKHKRIEAEQKMKKQSWYTIQNNVPHNIVGDDDIYQTDQDHEARVQTYYEDVDAYAKRFVAFDALLSTIWNVDCTIMHTVRQRCGPVGHFDLKQHKQITRMTDKYLTKATY
ncbi:hypothetical protein L7F22_044191 [Adiantum nelumboides]|nr:hypothetical protein [Adiantum nelumboides]